MLRLNGQTVTHLYFIMTLRLTFYRGMQSRSSLGIHCSAWYHLLDSRYDLGTAVKRSNFSFSKKLNPCERAIPKYVERCTIVVHCLQVFSFIRKDFCAKLIGTTVATAGGGGIISKKVPLSPEGPSRQLRLILGLSEGLTLACKIFV